MTTSTALALLRVFVRPSNTSFPPIPLTSVRIRPPLLKAVRRIPSIQSRSVTTKQPKRKVRLPRDEEITGAYVQIVNSQGHLDPPRLTQEALRSFDREKNFLIQVEPPNGDTPAICRLYDKKTLKDSEKAAAKAQKRSQRVAKKLEMSWVIDKNDLAHRLQKLQDFLEKGARVELLIAMKRRGKPSTENDAEALVDQILEKVKEVGAKEARPMEGQLGKHALFVFEGVRKSA
ncbi:MAG: hypothetical protein M1825_001978 [Sarcosagium campestre]|nr:MAG: hypothetical protein M1825_001978 [Sarcosagium campestre]